MSSNGPDMFVPPSGFQQVAWSFVAQLFFFNVQEISIKLPMRIEVNVLSAMDSKELFKL